MGKKRWGLSGVLSVLIVLSAGWQDRVQSQEKYPSRAIDILCPFAPGASTDIAARIAASYLNKKWGVPVNVINKPGGNTLPANVEVYSAAPNGYTVLNDTQSASSMLGVVIKDLPFKVMDRTVVAILYSFPMMFMVPANSPYKSLEDVIADAKRDPGNFTWASGGGVSGQDYITRQLFKVIGVDVSKTKPVMAKGGAQATALTAGGNVKLGSTAVITAQAAIKAGTIRMLGISYQRNPEFPDVPTFAELGYPTVNVVVWNGFSGPPKLPSHIVDVWDKAVQEMVKDPEFISRLAKIGGIPFYLNSREAKDYVKKEMEEINELYGVKNK